MKHADALAAIVAACKALNGAEIPTFAIYHDDEGWHLAGPQVAGNILAATLRQVADSCEQQMRPEGASLN